MWIEIQHNTIPEKISQLFTTKWLNVLTPAECCAGLVSSHRQGHRERTQILYSVSRCWHQKVNNRKHLIYYIITKTNCIQIIQLDSVWFHQLFMATAAIFKSLTGISGMVCGHGVSSQMSTGTSWCCWGEQPCANRDWTESWRSRAEWTSSALTSTVDTVIELKQLYNLVTNSTKKARVVDYNRGRYLAKTSYLFIKKTARCSLMDHLVFVYFAGHRLHISYSFSST